MIWIQSIHRQFKPDWIAPPTKGPSAMPTTLVMPKMDIGKLRSRSPFQMSVMVPPTMLIATELAPPPKKRVITIVAKFGAVAEGMRKIRKMM